MKKIDHSYFVGFLKACKHSAWILLPTFGAMVLQDVPPEYAWIVGLAGAYLHNFAKNRLGWKV